MFQCYFFPCKCSTLCSVPVHWCFQSDNISERADMVSDETTITNNEAEVLQEEAEDAARMANG